MRIFQNKNDNNQKPKTTGNINIEEMGRNPEKKRKKESDLKGKRGKATCMTQDHWDKSRICALLKSKHLNPRKTNKLL